MAYRVPKRRPDREPPTARIVGASMILGIVLMPILEFLDTVSTYREQHADIHLLLQKPNKVALIPLMLSVLTLIVAIALDLKSTDSRVIRWAYGITALLILAAIYLFLTRTPLVAVEDS